MKLNIFVPTRNGGKFTDQTVIHSSIIGDTVGGPSAPEDEIINSIDHSRMSDEKSLALNFIEFLGNRRLKIEDIKSLPLEEQLRLKQEFISR